MTNRRKDTDEEEELRVITRNISARSFTSIGIGTPRAPVGQAVHHIATNWISRTFMSGCAILFPLVITVVATKWLIDIFDSAFSPIYAKLFHVEIFGLGFITAMIIIFLAGILGQSWIGVIV